MDTFIDDMKDFYTDFGYNFIRMFKDKEVPSFVKEAESLDPESVAALPSSAFADSDSRTLPITDAANVFVSAAYYYGANDKNASVEERILKAAELFEIADQVKELSASLSGGDKIASETPGNPWKIDVETSIGAGKASGDGPESLAKFAGEFCDRLFDLFTFEQKVECAQKIASETKRLGGTVPDRILEVAGINVPDTEKLARQIKARAVRIPGDDGLKTDLCKMADDLESAEGKTLEGMFKVAKALSEIDRQYGMVRFYGTSMADPFASVFNTKREVAVKLASVVAIGDKNYSSEELAEIPTGVLKVALSEPSQKLIGLGTESYDPCKIASLDESERSVLASYL